MYHLKSEFFNQLKPHFDLDLFIQYFSSLSSITASRRTLLISMGEKGSAPGRTLAGGQRSINAL